MKAIIILLHILHLPSAILTAGGDNRASEPAIASLLQSDFEKSPSLVTIDRCTKSLGLPDLIHLRRSTSDYTWFLDESDGAFTLTVTDGEITAARTSAGRELNAPKNYVDDLKEFPSRAWTLIALERDGALFVVNPKLRHKLNQIKGDRDRIPEIQFFGK